MQQAHVKVAQVHPRPFGQKNVQSLQVELGKARFMLAGIFRLSEVLL